MNATIDRANVSIRSHGNAPSADVILCQDGSRYIVFSFDVGMLFYLYGVDGEAVTSARSIAARMNEAADELERSLMAEPPAEFEEEVRS